MIDQRRNQQFVIREDNLKKRCSAAGIEYKPAVVNEKRHITRCRRETMLLLLKDPEAIQRRTKKQARDRKRKLTEKQRTNKNKKMRIKYSNISKEEKNTLHEKQKARRSRSRLAAVIDTFSMLSIHNNHQSSKEIDINANHSHINDTDDLLLDNHDNATISGNTIIFDDHDNFTNNVNNNSRDTIITSYIYLHEMKPGPHNITKAHRPRYHLIPSNHTVSF